MSQLFRILPAEGMLEEADGAAERVWRTRRRSTPPPSSQNLARWPALWTGWRSRPACGAAIRSLARSLPPLPPFPRSPARSHYPPASLPPLSLFSDTEKGTPPPPPSPLPPSLPVPPFHQRQTNTIIFPFFFFFLKNAFNLGSCFANVKAASPPLSPSSVHHSISSSSLLVTGFAAAPAA